MPPAAVDDGSTVPGLLSIPDSAEYLGVSVATLYREIAAGALPTVQIRDRALLRAARAVAVGALGGT
jgi:excisionase family DNA binding protein